ncbi:MAG: SMP-30/gluconolactonase/LRE family protein [Phycisphaerae bacterium]
MNRRKFLKTAAISTTGALAAVPAVARASATPAQIAEFNLPINIVRGPYKMPPDMQKQKGVPRGVVFNFSINDSKYFPGTQRTISVYVPAQYKADKPACVWVMLDTLLWAPPVLLDNLIHQKAMPVTISVALVSGVTPSRHPPADPRWNRSFEFDSLTDVLGEFVLHELLPEVQKQKTPDGRAIILSDDPNDRALAGGSTGGIGAFTLAWNRPDAFRRVFTLSATLVGMRGGNRYAVLVRKTEPKPLRVFMLDGCRDEWWGGPEFGDWWLSNVEMERALFYAGYQVNHVWGVWGHADGSGAAAAFFPQAVRWLWENWPKPIAMGTPGNVVIRRLAQPGKPWKMVFHEKTAPAKPKYPRSRYVAGPVVDATFTVGQLACDQRGRIFFQNPSNGNIRLLTGSGTSTVFAKVHPGNNGLAFGADGQLYVTETATSRLLVCNPSGHTGVLAEALAGRSLAVTHEGNIYVTESPSSDSYSGKVWLIRPNGEKLVVAEGLNGPSGIGLTPDGLWLCAAEHDGHHAWSYQVKADGTLQYGEPFYWFHVPDAANDSGIGQVCWDANGWGYAATRLGVQVFTNGGGEGGLVYAILPVDEKQIAGICFGDKDFKTLYVSTGSRIYSRSTKAIGVPQWKVSVS